MQGLFNAIFCRNVVIYFNAETQAKVWGRLAPLLEPGGVLYIGHSERISGVAEQMLRNDGRDDLPLPRARSGHVMSIRVLVVDDSPTMRGLITARLRADPLIEVVGQAAIPMKPGRQSRD